jgi:L-ascorbate metabolism protein UlaG (beta-lactamase superfamily)
MGALAIMALAVLAVILILPRWLDDRYYIGPVSDHYDGERFFNPGAPSTTRGPGAFLRWQLAGNRAEWPAQLPVTPASPAPRVEGDHMIVTAVGHASLLVQTAGLNILTDPVWSERVSPFAFAGPKRVRAPGIAFEDLPKIDVVLVSHNHYDHLDLDTLERLWKRDRPIIVTPLGNAALMARRGIVALARDWGETVGINPDVSVTVERVQHWSSRWGSDRNRALWGGFTVATPGGSIFFAGDCGYSDAFRAAAMARGPYRLALLPIGAYEPRWFMKPQHMNPAEAVQAFKDLGTQQAVGIHWGVWQLTDEAIDAPRQALADALRSAGIAPARFPALKPGEALAVPPVAASARTGWS